MIKNGFRKKITSKSPPQPESGVTGFILLKPVDIDPWSEPEEPRTPIVRTGTALATRTETSTVTFETLS